MVVTDAEYQTMFIELTGSTADIIPLALVLLMFNLLIQILIRLTNLNLSLNLLKKKSLKNNPFGVD